MKKLIFALAGVAIIGTGAYIGYEHVSSKDNVVDSDIQVAPEQSSSESKDKDVSEEQIADESQNTDNTQQHESASGEASQVTSQSEKENQNDDVKPEKVDPAKGLPASHTYHLTAQDGTTVYCSYDPNKKIFVENVRDGETPRTFAIGGKELS
ncbi:hypothetical protein WVIC16_60110 [Weissella viridescens]|nr:hypothetical protein WVIC16_60110 [Weissella viridescens]